LQKKLKYTEAGQIENVKNSLAPTFLLRRKSKHNPLKNLLRNIVAQNKMPVKSISKTEKIVMVCSRSWERQ